MRSEKGELMPPGNSLSVNYQPLFLGLACRLELWQNSAPRFPQRRSDDEATRPNEDHIVGYKKERRSRRESG